MNKTTPTCRLYPSRSSHSDVESILASSCDSTPTTSSNRHWDVDDQLHPSNENNNTYYTIEKYLAVFGISCALDNSEHLITTALIVSLTK